MHKCLVRVLVVLLHSCFSVVSPMLFILAAIFFPDHPCRKYYCTFDSMVRDCGSNLYVGMGANITYRTVT